MKVGIDLVRVERFEKMADCPEKQTKIFNAEEVEYIKSKKGANVKGFKKFATVCYTTAGLYACKEAVLKALGVGINKGTSLTDVVVSHDKKGACVILLKGKAEGLFNAGGFNEICANISHDGDYATAICVIN